MSRLISARKAYAKALMKERSLALFQCLMETNTKAWDDCEIRREAARLDTRLALCDLAVAQDNARKGQEQHEYGLLTEAADAYSLALVELAEADHAFNVGGLFADDEDWEALKRRQHETWYAAEDAMAALQDEQARAEVWQSQLRRESGNDG